MSQMTPREIVQELDKHIVGQGDAKRAVAIALRNRWRRMQVDEPLRSEITPKNILMIGPTGVGKTEIARRLARLARAPFIKVEATKFTEVGYVGRDVESIIRDLTEISLGQVRTKRTEECMEEARKRVEDSILDQLVPDIPKPQPYSESTQNAPVPTEASQATTRERFREKLRKGEMEDKLIEPEIEESPVGLQMHAIGLPAGMTGGLENLGTDLKDLLEGIVPKRRARKQISIAEARPLMLQQELEHLVDQEALVREAIERVEQNAIVFLDEVDKIVGREGGSGPDVSREGVQRDILPIVEGSTVITKYGPVRTDHVLFIAAGAFYIAKPSDLIPELQGRFPIRVELDSLETDDLKRILTEPKNSLVSQYVELLRTEGVSLVFAEDAIEEIAEFSSRINNETENIGARRLHTVMEKILEEISFGAPDADRKKFKIDADYVRERLKDIVEDIDLSRYVL